MSPTASSLDGRAWAQSLPPDAGAARERAILDAVREGHATPWAPYPLRLAVGRHEVVVYVMPDALKIGAMRPVRVTVSHRTAQRIADHLGAYLLTPRLSDLVHAHAEVVIGPQLQRPDAQMARTARMLQHHDAVEAAIVRATSRDSGLVSTVGKDWVLTNRLVGQPRRAANYGWHDPSAPNRKCWQPLGLAHDLDHVDYSQVLRLVHGSALVDRVAVDLAEVLVHPELSKAVSDEGPLKLLRHPGVPPPGSSSPPVPKARPGGPLVTRFVKARNYRPGRRPGPVDLVVLHSMEAPEKGSTAEAVAAWFAGPHAPTASAHYCIDSDSVIQCVAEGDTAWHAPGANHNGIGLEHAGYARQTETDWLDAYGLEMLARSARLCADVCRRHAIPPVFVDARGLKAGLRGVTTHHEVSQAWRKSSHYDPGPGFPMGWYLEAVRAYYEAFEEVPDGSGLPR